MKEYFPESAFKKKVFFFVDDDRTSLEDIRIDSEINIYVKNEQGEMINISFRVTRNAYLGKKTRWIYGMVLNTPDDEYHQIELKLHKGEPEIDTIEVFLQAPPAIIDKLH